MSSCVRLAAMMPASRATAITSPLGAASSRIMAAKRTHELIPLCHQLNLSVVSVELEADHALPGLRVTAEARLHGRTGVEMEALVAASVAALTIYDMCKAIDRGMEVTGVRLLEKSGGRSGTWRRDEQAGAATKDGA